MGQHARSEGSGQGVSGSDGWQVRPGGQRGEVHGGRQVAHRQADGRAGSDRSLHGRGLRCPSGCHPQHRLHQEPDGGSDVEASPGVG